NSRGAISALSSAEFSKRLLQRMKLGSYGHTFNGRNLVALHRNAKSQTRKDRTAVHQHRAATAFAQFAAVLCAGSSQILAKYLQQRLVRSEGNFDFFTIDLKPEMRFLQLSLAVLPGFLHELGPHRTIWQPPFWVKCESAQSFL